MDLYLVRHGIAVDLGENGVSRDFDRMLSEEGVLRTRQAGRGLARFGVVPDRVLTSPLVRAVETADLVREELGVRPDVEVFDLLQPGGAPAAVTRALSERAEQSLMLVGHMPDMAELASWLIAGTADLDLAFKKAAVCAISFYHEVEAGAGQLLWHLPPRALRLLAEK